SATCTDGLCRARTGEPVRFENVGGGTVRQLLWDFGDGASSRRSTVDHLWQEPGFYEVALWVSDGTTASEASLRFLVEASEPQGTCEADDDTRCLQHSRFSVEMDWWAGDGRSGSGLVVREGTDDSALFRFFEPDNWEVLVKVLDGCALNDHVWVFGASATTLGYSIRVTDTVTGAVREYGNDPGTPAAAITDSQAFPGSCQPP
ncbi:MAG: PKD domain-containing protein, partial [Boseongicola sp. SB0677_bin_26]|nr:PKD domain-containing protein [Boseongicola sp. SB0677_bin_26]